MFVSILAGRNTDTSVPSYRGTDSSEPNAPFSFTGKNLAGHFALTTARWSKGPPIDRAWPCRSGASRQWMLLKLAPSGSIGGPGRRAQRSALPPHHSTCSTAWLARGVALPGSRSWHVINPSPPARTVGGPAMVPVRRAELQRQRHHWSLPQRLLPMSDVSERLPVCAI